MKIWAPGTADLFPYDDESWFSWTSENPMLYALNKSTACRPQKDMTLIAGIDGFLNSENSDMVVPVDSVFCRTSNQKDGDMSLLTAGPGAKKTEKRAGFNHFNFGKSSFRIKDKIEVEMTILEGLSDWVVAKILNEEINRTPGSTTVNNASMKIEVQYNAYGRQFKRVALVIYGRDVNNNWHPCGDTVAADGTVLLSEPIDGNSNDLPSLNLSASYLLEGNGLEFWDVVFVFYPLTINQTKVPLNPTAAFGLPK